MLAHAPYGGDTVAEAGGDFGSAPPLVVEFEDALADGNRDGFHNHDLPHPQESRYIICGNDLTFHAALVNEPTGLQVPERAFELFKFRGRAVNFQP